jgi:3'-5' exoribonuclease
VETDWFLCISRKEELKTREGKPYFRVSLRDASREITIPIWQDSAWFEKCRQEWQAGSFYKIRGTMRETQFGSQVEIHKIRETTPADVAEGFDPLALLPRTRFDVGLMFAELLQLMQNHIQHEGLRGLTLEIFTTHRTLLSDMPAAVHHHHAFRGGFLEHLLNVVRNAVFLAEKYSALHPHVLNERGRDLVVAGALLHDIGKVRELQTTPSGAEYTAVGELIGHALLGRDMIRELAEKFQLDADLQLRLEHILISHQRTPEWGAAKPPMTLEALLVYYADDIDARAQMLVEALQHDAGTGLVTSPRNALQQKVYRGRPANEASDERL